MCSVGLEFLRPDHGREEVDEEQHCDAADEDGFHGRGWRAGLEFFAEADIETAGDEEADEGGQVHEVSHEEKVLQAL